MHQLVNFHTSRVTRIQDRAVSSRSSAVSRPRGFLPLEILSPNRLTTLSQSSSSKAFSINSSMFSYLIPGEMTRGCSGSNGSSPGRCLLLTSDRRLADGSVRKTDRVETEWERGHTLLRNHEPSHHHAHRERRIQCSGGDDQGESVLVSLLSLCGGHRSASVDRLDSDLGYVPKYVEHPL